MWVFEIGVQMEWEVGILEMLGTKSREGELTCVQSGRDTGLCWLGVED